MFFDKIVNKKKFKKFKRRSTPKTTFNTNKMYVRTHVYYPSGGRVELWVYKRILRVFRRRSRRRRYTLNFLFRPNYIHSRKSKNSRMGKGKGKFSRLTLNLPANKLFMTVTGLSHQRVVLFFAKIHQNTRYRFAVRLNKKYGL